MFANHVNFFLPIYTHPIIGASLSEPHLDGKSCARIYVLVEVQALWGLALAEVCWPFGCLCT